WEEPNELLNEEHWDRLQQERRWGKRGVAFRAEVFERMVKLIDLYDARLTNQFLKLLHEIERLQRLRAGEDVPPPVVAEVTVQTDARDVCREPAEAPHEAADIAPDGATTSEGTLPVESENAGQTTVAEGRVAEGALRDEAVAASPEQLPDAADRAEAAQGAT
ncbi:MAG: hypothetical protein ACLQVA_10985, partial [Candidatus Brocadiia bacterium]